MKYKDPFLGELELLEVGKITMAAMGAFCEDIIYVHKQSGYYWIKRISMGEDAKIQESMRCVERDIIDKILEYERSISITGH